MQQQQSRSWWRRETPVPNWALACFAVLVISGLIDLAGRAIG
jgi:hypothetical protein